LRVISGIRKGHKLKAPKGMDVRPTEDKVKESLFNILRNIDEDSLVLDLFAGSGAVGIEFISRGAKECYFIDISRNSLDTVKENLIHTNLLEKGIIIKNDAIRSIRNFNSKNLKFDYIFIDPPYRQDGLVEKVLKVICENNILKDTGIIIVEHEKELELETMLYCLEKSDCRNYGSKSLSFYRKNCK
jgi:16S rRNA (guanine(966)-N(2))-methyltransferase RsmD